MQSDIQKAIDLLKTAMLNNAVYYRDDMLPTGKEVETFYTVGKVRAVKMYKERTGCTLKESYDIFTALPPARGADGFSNADITMIINGDWATLMKKYNKHTLVTFLNKSPLLGDFLAYCWQYNIFS